MIDSAKKILSFAGPGLNRQLKRQDQMSDSENSEKILRKAFGGRISDPSPATQS